MGGGSGAWSTSRPTPERMTRTPRTFSSKSSLSRRVLIDRGSFDLDLYNEEIDGEEGGVGSWQELGVDAAKTPRRYSCVNPLHLELMGCNSVYIPHTEGEV